MDFISSLIPNIFWVWYGSVISAVASISILILVIIQTYYFTVNYTKSNASCCSLVFIVNILTILAMILYIAASIIGGLMYAQFTQNLMECGTFNIIASYMAFLSMYCKWIVLMLRLRIAYNTSIFEYSIKQLTISVIVFTAILLMFCILSALFLGNSNGNIDDNGYIICGVDIPIWFGGLMAICDISISFIFMYLFVNPLRIMYKRKDIASLEKTVAHSQVTKSTATISDKTCTTSPENSVNISTTNNDMDQEQQINDKNDYKDIKDFVKKYAMLTSIAAISTFIFYFIMGITGNGAFSIPDFIFNSYCLGLMSHWYSNEDNKCYNRMCCGVIKCVNRLWSK